MLRIISKAVLGIIIGRAPHLTISVVKPVNIIYVCNMIVIEFCLVMNNNLEYPEYIEVELLMLLDVWNMAALCAQNS